jgi:hypothetical protein
MRLYLVHYGFYDEDLSDGIFEFHINIPVAAVNADEAKQKVRLDPTFTKKKMHIDGMQEIRSVGGSAITLGPLTQITNETPINSIPYRDL